MIGETLNKIELTDIEAELFLAFRKHQTEFMVLKASGIFDLKNGSITIHKDVNGIVRQIETNQVVFKV